MKSFWEIAHETLAALVAKSNRTEFELESVDLCINGGEQLNIYRMKDGSGYCATFRKSTNPRSPESIASTGRGRTAQEAINAAKRSAN